MSNPKPALHRKWSQQVAEASAGAARMRPGSDAYDRAWAAWNAYENAAAALKTTGLDDPLVGLDALADFLHGRIEHYSKDEDPRADHYRAMLRDLEAAADG